MGMFEEQDTIDTFGIPEYFVTQLRTESVGSNVRLICGTRRGGAVHWLYSCIIPSEILVMMSRQCADAAETAITIDHVLMLTH